MASLPYPLCHDCPTGLVGMAGMPYPPTICKDNSELLLIYSILLGRIKYTFFEDKISLFNEYNINASTSQYKLQYHITETPVPAIWYCSTDYMVLKTVLSFFNEMHNCIYSIPHCIHSIPHCFYSIWQSFYALLHLFYAMTPIPNE